MTAKLVFPDDVRPDFEGFSDAAFGFLKGLARNNERGWFNENRETYETEVRFPLECLVAEFRPGGAGKELPVRGDPTRASFRIYRDIRFSKNLYFAGSGRVQLTAALYNALNTNATLRFNRSFGPNWLTPIRIMQARMFKVGATVNF